MKYFVATARRVPPHAHTAAAVVAAGLARTKVRMILTMCPFLLLYLWGWVSSGIGNRFQGTLLEWI